jgi:hypothetical protein
MSDIWSWFVFHNAAIWAKSDKSTFLEFWINFASWVCAEAEADIFIACGKPGSEKWNYRIFRKPLESHVELHLHAMRMTETIKGSFHSDI